MPRILFLVLMYDVRLYMQYIGSKKERIEEMLMCGSDRTQEAGSEEGIYKCLVRRLFVPFRSPSHVGF